MKKLFLPRFWRLTSRYLSIFKDHKIFSPDDDSSKITKNHKYFVNYLRPWLTVTRQLKPQDDCFYKISNWVLAGFIKLFSQSWKLLGDLRSTKVKLDHKQGPSNRSNSSLWVNSPSSKLIDQLILSEEFEYRTVLILKIWEFPNMSNSLVDPSKCPVVT